jgi:hypothetical protein
MNKSKYLWKLLERPGDYFIVPYEVMYYYDMIQRVKNRNRIYGGLYEYSCENVPSKGESWVILTSIVSTKQDMVLTCKGTVFFR